MILDRQHYKSLMVRLEHANEIVALAKTQIRNYLSGSEWEDGVEAALSSMSESDLDFMLMNTARPTVWYTFVVEEMERRGIDVMKRSQDLAKKGVKGNE